EALSPGTKIFACEPETGAPVSATLANGGVPVAVDYRASFVDGSGSKALLPSMWEGARALVDDAFALSLDETAAAGGLIGERAHGIAGGAGALAVAAAVSGRAGGGRLVCIVSGGNIDPDRLAAILRGETPD